MGITINGPDWPSLRALRAELAHAPEFGSYPYGALKHDSIEQLTLLRDAGVQVPEFTASLPEAENWLIDEAIVFGRRLRHSQGRDIRIQTLNTSRIERSQWFSKFIPSTAEWRIHIFEGKSIARAKKYFSGEVTLNNPSGQVPAIPIRSRRLGWLMSHKDDPPKGMRSIAKNSVAALGYRHGAVDILFTDAGKFVVLEVNLLPAMDNYTRAAYVAAIRKFVRG